MSDSDPARWKAALSMFDFLIELPEAIRLEQLAFLAESDPALAAQVNALLDADQRQNGILEAPLTSVAPELGPAIRAQPVGGVSLDEDRTVARALPEQPPSEKWTGTGSRRRTFAMGNLIGSLVLILLAAGAFAITWSMVKDELAFLAGSQIVDGEVVDHVFLRSSDTGPASSRSGGGHYPIVRYINENGQAHQVQGRVGAGSRQRLTSGVESGENHHPVGSTLRVAYRRDNPEDARVLGFGQQYLLPLIFAVIGLVLLMFAVLVFRDGISPAA